MTAAKPTAMGWVLKVCVVMLVGGLLAGCSTSVVTYRHHDGRIIETVSRNGLLPASADDLSRHTMALAQSDIARTCAGQLGNTRERTELGRFCLEWVRNLHGFDPASNPHARARVAPARTWHKPIDQMTNAEYRRYWRARYGRY